MYTVDVERMAEMAKKKVGYFRTHPMGYLVLSALAGIYLGFGICLVFSVASLRCALAAAFESHRNRSPRRARHY